MVAVFVNPVPPSAEGLQILFQLIHLQNLLVSLPHQNLACILLMF